MSGKGTIRLRFDFIFRIASLEVVAPIREQNLTRGCGRSVRKGAQDRSRS